MGGAIWQLNDRIESFELTLNIGNDAVFKMLTMDML